MPRCIYIRYLLIGLLAVFTEQLSASCGAVDYSNSADALAQAHDYVVTMMLYVVYMGYAVASIVSIISILEIFIKIQAGEEGIKKEILYVLGGIFFIIGASIVFPAFFGYSFNG